MKGRGPDASGKVGGWQAPRFGASSAQRGGTSSRAPAGKELGGLLLPKPFPPGPHKTAAGRVARR
eukprot:2691275-Alexandrium_andersonii.AAC.1